MEEKKSSFLSDSYLQYIGPLIIFLGVIRVQTYYGEFGINILQFMDLSEALTSFLDFIIYIVVYLLVHLTTTFLIQSNHDTFHSDRFQKILNTASFFKRLKYYLFDIAEVFFLFGFIILATYVISYFNDDKITKKYIYYMLLVALIIIAISVIFNEIAFKNHNHKRSDEKKVLVYLTFFSLLIIGFVVLKSYMEANAVKDNSTFKGVVIELADDSPIYSNEESYYIGKTNNYVFVHDEKTGKTKVIPMSRVKAIMFLSGDKR